MASIELDSLTLDSIYKIDDNVNEKSEDVMDNENCDISYNTLNLPQKNVGPFSNELLFCENFMKKYCKIENNCAEDHILVKPFELNVHQFQCIKCNFQTSSLDILQNHFVLQHDNCLKILKKPVISQNQQTSLKRYPKPPYSNSKNKQSKNQNQKYFCEFERCDFVTIHKKNLNRHRRNRNHYLNQKCTEVQDITKNITNLLPNQNKTSKREQSETMESNAKKKQSKNINHKEYVLPFGWKKKCSKRVNGKSAGKWDVVLICPFGTILRSNVELNRYLQKNPNIEHDPKVTKVTTTSIRNKIEGVEKNDVTRKRIKNPKILSKFVCGFESCKFMAKYNFNLNQHRKHANHFLDRPEASKRQHKETGTAKENHKEKVYNVLPQPKKGRWILKLKRLNIKVPSFSKRRA